MLSVERMAIAIVSSRWHLMDDIKWNMRVIWIYCCHVGRYIAHAIPAFLVSLSLLFWHQEENEWNKKEWEVTSRTHPSITLWIELRTDESLLTFHLQQQLICRRGITVLLWKLEKNLLFSGSLEKNYEAKRAWWNFTSCIGFLGEWIPSPYIKIAFEQSWGHSDTRVWIFFLFCKCYHSTERKIFAVIVKHGLLRLYFPS